MATVLSKGVIVPDPGETDWAGYLAINWGKLNDVVGAALPDVQNIWTQPQIFQNNIYLTNTSYTVGTIPTSNITATLFFAGASNYQIGYCRGVVYRTTGQTSAELTARNKFTNGALDPAGSYTNATFTVNLDADGTRWIQFANCSIKNGLIPYATDTYNIGSAANQWLRLFAKFYYYNGTAWGLDQANVWTANQKIIGNNSRGVISIYNPAYTKGGALSVTDLSIGSIYMGDEGRTGLANSLVFISTDIGSSGASTLLSLSAMENTTSSTNRANLVVTYDKNDAENPRKVTIQGTVIPHPSVPFSLGTSTNKWKTLNGVNPGALSLPINVNSTSFNIDTTNWTTDGSIIAYTPLLDGWIYINARNDDTNGDSFIIFDDGVSGFGTSVFGNKGLLNNGVGLLCLMMPVNKNNGINIRIKSPGIISARLYPCNGNV